MFMLRSTSMKSILHLALSLTVMASGFMCLAQTKHLSPAEQHYLRGKKLIESNCTDCNGGNAAGMEEGIHEVEAALTDGFTNQIAAYKLLSDAYNAMSAYTESDPKKSDIYSAKQVEIDRKLYELNPKDTRTALAYVHTLHTDDERVLILRQIVKDGPQDAKAVYQEASYELGLILVKGNAQYREGVTLVAETIAREEDAEAVRTYAGGLINAFNQRGCPLEGEKHWEDELNRAFNKAISGPGDPGAISSFKKDFAKAIDGHLCGDANKQ